nr:hypothetical protein [Bradyrhizobium sp. CSA112]
MHPAAILQFERMIGEYITWRAVPETDRSPAPAWWWGPAMELRASPQSLPAEWCAELGLPDRATYASAAAIFLGTFAGQTSVPWPYDFPRKTAIPDPAVRELHPQPSDDSAFQP